MCTHCKIKSTQLTSNLVSLNPDSWSPETGLNMVTIEGWVSTADWARTSLPEGLYIHRNYQEMKWSRVSAY